MKLSGSTYHLTVFVAVLRARNTADGGPCRCPLRKCRRDRSCTGPLYTQLADATEPCLVAPADIDDLKHSAIVPVCMRMLDQATLEGVAAYLQALEQPVTVLSPDRAIGARTWTRCGSIFAPPPVA
jgi:hypothetical protein